MRAILISRIRPAIINSLFFVALLYKTHPILPSRYLARKSNVRPVETGRINTVRRGNARAVRFFAKNSLRLAKKCYRFEGRALVLKSTKRKTMVEPSSSISPVRSPVSRPSTTPSHCSFLSASSQFTRLPRLERLGSSGKTITTVSCGLTSTGDVKVH